MKNALVLGIDPSLNSTGYGLVAAIAPGSYRYIEGGILKNSPQRPLGVRLANIMEGTMELLEEFKPDYMALEELYSHYRHPQTAILMAHARGVIYASAFIKKIEVVNYRPAMVKKMITGKGSASKEQVRGMVQDMLGIQGRIKHYDVSDALALAIAHLMHLENIAP